MPKKKSQPISTTLRSPITTLLSNPTTLNLETSLTPEFLLTTSFQRKSLAQLLYAEIDEATTRGVTPELQWGGDPTRPKEYYKRCFYAALLVGRAFAKVLRIADQGGSSEVRTLQTYDSSKEARSTRFLAQVNDNNVETEKVLDPVSPEDQERARTIAEDIWKTCIADTINKGLFSPLPSLEPGCLVVLGTILLASSHSMSTHPVLCTTKGKGDKGWGGGTHEPDTVWGWKDVKNAVRETKNIPRDNYRVGKVKASVDWYYKELARRQESGLEPVSDESAVAAMAYIPLEALAVMDMAREHVLEGRHDLSSQDIIEQVYDKLMEA